MKLACFSADVHRTGAKDCILLRGGPQDGRLTVVEDGEREELRRLALWLSRRRAVDEALEMLTAYGPAACERVHRHLDALRTLLAAEQAAFAAVERCAPVLPQTPLPALLERPSRETATVHSLGAARERHLT